MKYLFCSVALHLGLLLTWQWSCSAHEYGLVPKAFDENPIASTFPIELISPRSANPAAPSAAPPKRADNVAPARVFRPKVPSEQQSAQSANAAAEPARQESMPIGSLTRLPRPFAEIDLDVPELKRIRFAGKVELMLQIEVDGTVSDVTPAEESEISRVFTDLVAARFKAAKFIPGEIDGKPVRSKLRITVVSEFVPPPEVKQKNPMPIDAFIP